jgi:hypothetical protein
MIYVIATTPMKPENKDDFIKGTRPVPPKRSRRRAVSPMTAMSA